MVYTFYISRIVAFYYLFLKVLPLIVNVNAAMFASIQFENSNEARFGISLFRPDHPLFTNIASNIVSSRIALDSEYLGRAV